MKLTNRIVLVAAAFAAGTFTSRAVVLVDDTWASSARTNQNLPTSSAWFVSSAASVAAYTNFFSLTNQANGTSSSEWSTYFTPLGIPSALGVGDTLTVTLEFSVQGMPDVGNTSQNMRYGLVSSAAGARSTTDAAINALNYTGYSIFGNFGPVFNRGAGCFDFKRRTTTSTSGLLGTSGDWTTIGLPGGSTTGSPGFTNGGDYTLTFSVTRDAESQNTLVATYSGGGLANTHTVVDTTGVHTNFDCFVMRPSGATTTSTNFILKRFKVEGPAGTPPPPAIVTPPQDLTRVVGTLAAFTVSASGGAPLRYQWYYSNVTVTALSGRTNSSLQLTNVQTSQAGGYLVVVTNAQGAATSSVASLTVNLPNYTPLGVVLDDVWEDGTKDNEPIDSSNSVWRASTAGSLTASVGLLTATPSASASRTWVGYLVENPNEPVDLAVGRALRARLTFTPNNVAAQNTSSLRFGLFNYADGANRLTADGFGSISTNVSGFMVTANFGYLFGDDTPFELYARVNMASGDLMGSTGDFNSMGAGPSGSLDLPGFSNAVPYTLEFLIERTGENTAQVTTKFTGGALNISHSRPEAIYAYRRFDAFAVRANRTIDSADSLDISRLLVEVVNAAPSQIPLNITSTGGNVTLTWSNPAFVLQAAPAVTGTYTNVSSAVSGYTTAAGGAQKFFRLFYP